MRQAQKLSGMGIGAAALFCAVGSLCGSVTLVSAEQPDWRSASAGTNSDKTSILAQTPTAPGTTPSSPPNGSSTTPGPSIQLPNTQINPDPAGGAVLPVAPAPPFLPRAVAPPVGDISVSNIDASAGAIELGTTAIVPRLVLKDAPVREVLELLARTAGLNLAFIGGATPGQAAPGGVQAASTVTLNLENEPVQNVFNYVLQISGLQANRIGSTIFVGSELPSGVRNLITRSFRLNQVSAGVAAAFLSAQGASGQRVTEQAAVTALTAAGGTGPLLLRGMSVLTDERLNAITLIGEPRQVQIATSLLTQLDARRRQVAVNVKIIDVNLLNTENFNTSFSFGVGQGFFTVDNGAAAFNFGGFRPPTSGQLAASPVSPPVITNPLAGATVFVDPNNPILVPGTGVGTRVFNNGALTTDIPGGSAAFPSPIRGIPTDPLQTGIINVTPGTPTIQTITTIPATPPTLDANGNVITPGTPARDVISTTPGTPGTITTGLPALFQFPSRFLSLLQAQIQSGNGKILTDPTLMVQEGERTIVNLSQQVFAGFRLVTQAVPNSNVTSQVQEPIIRDAGLILDIQVSRIDDNGFVTLSVNPTVSAPSSSASTPQGNITLLQQRQMQSGQIRIRDGQTLIMSGIIQESDTTTVTKVPILGDIPILGALFRSTNRQNQRNEVIVLLTPQIVDDSSGSSFGYNYTPGSDVRQILQRQPSPTTGGNR